MTGRVRFTPADPLDAVVEAAFNDHQRRTVDGRRLLGPDAVAATVAAFARRGRATCGNGPARGGSARSRPT